jgi:hypothetical protein
MGTGAMASELPAPAAIEVGNQDQEPVSGGMDVGRQGGDLFLQLLQSIGIVEGVREGGGSGVRDGPGGRGFLRGITGPGRGASVDVPDI